VPRSPWRIAGLWLERAFTVAVLVSSTPVHFTPLRWK